MISTSPIHKAYNWIQDRIGLEGIMHVAEKKQVPIHKHGLWYYMGGILMVFMLVQIITGILLMMYYIPELKSAHASILFITSRVEFGWFIRSLHSWGANLMILAAFFHMFSTFFMKAYRPPRELTWLTGMILLVLCMGFGFSGYLLPWDEVSYFATKIGLDITSKLPVIGESMAYILRGGTTISQATITRFFAIHVIILPLALLALVGIHLFFVQLKGMSAPKSFNALPENEKSYEPFFPNFFLKDLMVWLLVLNLLGFLVAMFPWGLGPEADPSAAAPMGIKPEWYFLAMFQFLKLVPAQIGPIEGEVAGLGFFGLIALVFLLAPFVDTDTHPIWDKCYTWFGRLVVSGFVVFTIWGAMAS